MRYGAAAPEIFLNEGAFAIDLEHGGRGSVGRGLYDGPEQRRETHRKSSASHRSGEGSLAGR